MITSPIEPWSVLEADSSSALCGCAAYAAGNEATFDEPTGIAVAPNGDLFVLEPHGPRVRKISGGKVTTIHRGLP